MPYFAKHSLTGEIAEYPDNYRDHPVFSRVLTEVPKPTRGCTDCSLPAEPVVVVETSEEEAPSWNYLQDFNTPERTEHGN